MAKLTLVVRPDGRAILTSAAPLADSEVRALREAIAGWDDETLLVLDRCEVVRVETIDLVLELGLDQREAVPA